MIGPYGQRRLQRRLDASFAKAGVDANVAQKAFDTAPTSIRGIAQRDAISFAKAVGQAKAAQTAPWGSLAQQNDPNRYGSLASTKSTLFDSSNNAARLQRRAAVPAPMAAQPAPAAAPAPATFDPDLVGSAPAPAGAPAPPPVNEPEPLPIPGRARRRAAPSFFESAPITISTTSVFGDEDGN